MADRPSRGATPGAEVVTPRETPPGAIGYRLRAASRFIDSRIGAECSDNLWHLRSYG
jgi:hypothetical protein